MLEKIFGPSKEEIWKQLAKELSGNFDNSEFSERSNPKVQVQFKEWTITLDSFHRSAGKCTIPITRIRAPFLNKDGLKFKISKEDIFTNINKLFGTQDIIIGESEFDKKYLIQGNDELKVKKLLSNKMIRNLIDLQPDIHFEIKEDEGFFNKEEYIQKGAHLLYFESTQTIKDIEQLKSLYSLFAEMLNQLCKMDSAYENDPEIVL
ncbi:MAG: DUF3137 domain-containing protein [Flammeovirgaceae bacterium]|nr:DUF3137 domain-containing protein [Flammeovirgaceae bacterium]